MLKVLWDTRDKSAVRRRAARPVAALGAALSAAAFAALLIVFVVPAGAHSGRHHWVGDEPRADRGKGGSLPGASDATGNFSLVNRNNASLNCTGPISGRFTVATGDTAAITSSGGLVHVSVTLHNPSTTTAVTFYVALGQTNGAFCTNISKVVSVNIGPGGKATASGSVPVAAGSTGGVVSASLPNENPAIVTGGPAYYELTNRLSF